MEPADNEELQTLGITGTKDLYTALCYEYTFHKFSSFQGYDVCPGGRGEHTVQLGIPLSCRCSSTPALQKCGKVQEPGTEGIVQAPVPFAPHPRPEAPITSQVLLRHPLPVICSAPPPSEAFKQGSLQCFLLALSSSAKHQAPSHPFQQVYEDTSSSWHETA